MQGTTFWKRGCHKKKCNEGLGSSWILCGIRWQRNIPWRMKALNKWRENPSSSHNKKKFRTEWYQLWEKINCNMELLQIGIIMRDIFFSWLESAPSRPRRPQLWGPGIILRYTTIGRTPLEGWSTRCRDLYLITHTALTRDGHPCSRRHSNPQSQQERGHRPTPSHARPLGSSQAEAFFSPGATTPIGGCILQPSSGL